ncbi:MAG: HAMP domain-containing protein [Pseudolabrys sp.]|nr:HAMP domain-containing protein [Pseudolabrys sp.]
MIALLSGAWDSWRRVQTATRIVNNAEASSYLFTALHNVRVDRAFTFNGLAGEKVGDFIPLVRNARAAELAALSAGLQTLKDVEFPAGSTVVTDLREAVDRLVALHKESDAAIALPAAKRRAGLAGEFFKLGTALMEQLDKASAQLANMVKLEDPFIDQLLQLKQLAWIMRNAGGDAAALITNSLAGKPSAEPFQTYASAIGRATTAMTAVEEFSAGLPLPASFIEMIQRAKKEFFSADYAGQQVHVLKLAVTGQKPDVDVAQWNKTSVAKLGFQLKIAENALRLAQDRAAELRSRAQRNLILQLALLAVAVAVSAVTMVVITRRVSVPLRMVQDGMLKIANGNFNVTLPRIDRQDEVGMIVAAVNSMVEKIRATISEIKSSSREVTSASAEIATSTTDLSQRTEEQAASLEETTASMELISSTVRKNAENAQAATQSAVATRAVADRGGEVAARAVKAMARIEESSRKISDIISVIDEIARQTNLLALNAAVEAARAGEAGRGFAVVASEVRSLAQRSSQAAKDIAELITTSGSQVQEGVGLVNQAGEALNEVVESIRTVAAVVSDIATASAEQATGLDEIRTALNQMDEVTQRNSALVEENAATSLALEQQAKTMDEQVAFFQVEGDATASGQSKLPAGETASHAYPVQKRSKARGGKLGPKAVAA